jgi:hypothetical protein
MLQDTSLLDRVKLRRDNLRYALQGVPELPLGGDRESSEYTVLIPILVLLMLMLLSGMPELLFGALRSVDEATVPTAGT